MEDNKEHYLDNSATTRVLPEAARKAAEVMVEEYGNPSSLHTRGFRARQELEASRETVAARLGAKPEELYFTSGGTEGNNLALFGAAQPQPLLSAGKKRRRSFTPMRCRPLESWSFPLQSWGQTFVRSALIRCMDPRGWARSTSPNRPVSCPIPLVGDRRRDCGPARKACR